MLVYTVMWARYNSTRDRSPRRWGVWETLRLQESDAVKIR